MVFSSAYCCCTFKQVAGVRNKLQARLDNQMLESGLTTVLKALSGSLATWGLAWLARWTWARLVEEFTVQVGSVPCSSPKEPYV